MTINILKKFSSFIPSGVRHSFWNILDAGLYPLLYLASVPFLLRYMGVEKFGFWLVLNSLITILQLLNFNAGIANLGIAIIRNITEIDTEAGLNKAIKTINGIIRLTFLLLILSAIIGIVLSLTVVPFNWWGAGTVSEEHLSRGVFFACLIAGLKYFDQVFQSVIKAFERFKLSAILNMVNRFGLLVLNIVLAYQKYTLTNMLLCNLIFVLGYLLLQFFFVSRMIPAFKLGRVHDITVYKSILNHNFLPWVQALLVVFTFQSDRFWVSSYAGVSEVSGYGLTSTIFNHIHMIYTAMAIWMLPRMASMISKGVDPSQLYSKVRGILFGIIIGSLLLLLIVAPYLLPIWIGQEMFDKIFIYVKYFIAFEIVFCHSILPFFYLNLAGKEKLATKATAIYCALCYIGMVLGILVFKSPAQMITGMTLSLSISMPLVNYIVYGIMHQKYSIKNAIWEMIPMYTAVFLVYSQSNGLTLMAFLCLILFSVWRIYLHNIVDRRLWLKIVRN